jgi:hypothetical protein
MGDITEITGTMDTTTATDIMGIAVTGRITVTATGTILLDPHMGMATAGRV